MGKQRVVSCAEIIVSSPSAAVLIGAAYWFHCKIQLEACLPEVWLIFHHANTTSVQTVCRRLSSNGLSGGLQDHCFLMYSVSSDVRWVQT